MAWIKGVCISKTEEASIKEFLERQNLDENQVFSVQTLLREKIASHVWFNTGLGVFVAAIIFGAGLMLSS